MLIVNMTKVQSSGVPEFVLVETYLNWETR